MSETPVQSRRVELGLVLAVSALVLLATAHVPEGIVGDAAVQLRALQQYVAGQSPSLNHVVMPQPTDLAHDGAVWITWWPPGPQLVAYPWAAVGASLGTSARIVAALAMVLGSLGWLTWFRRFDLPRTVRYAAAAALPLLHSANLALFVFTQDVLNFALAPWLLVMVHALVIPRDRRVGWPIYAAAGLALGMTYVVKYSLVFVALGALAFLGFEALRRRRLVGSVIAAACGTAIPIVALTALNARMVGVMNNAEQTARFLPRWQSLVALIANPALAVADADSLWRYLLMHPAHPLTNDPLAIAYVGVLPGLVLLWFVFAAMRRRAIMATPAARLALALFGVTLLAMVATWTFSDAADYEARHMLPASLAVLPVAYASAANARRRLLPVTMAILFVVVPVVYGAVAVAGKITRIPRTYTPGPSRFYNELVTSTADPAAVERTLIERYGPATDVWYIAHAVTALDWPGRVWTETNLEFVPIEKLATLHFRTTAPVRLTVLLPPMFEGQGKGAVIRASFTGAGSWRRDTVPGSKYDVWTTVVEPTP